jgi:hypothetical protein
MGSDTIGDMPPRTDWKPRTIAAQTAVHHVALAEENERLRAENAELLNALRLADRLMKEGLPKFNWGASALDSNTITLLNEVPITISKALAKISDAQL